MPLVLADRVKDTTTTTGTGTITLSGTAPIGYVSFGTAIGNANTTYYTITAGSEWEVGIGTYTASGTTLSRDTVLASSAGGTTKVTFSAGTKDVFVTYPAGKAISDGFGTLPAANGGTGLTSPGTSANVLTSNGTAWVSSALPSSAVQYPQNSRSANYTLVLGDAGKQIFHPASDTVSRTYTIPANASVAFPIGTVVLFTVENGGASISVAINSDTLVLGSGVTGTAPVSPNNTLMAIKVTATKWMANYLTQDVPIAPYVFALVNADPSTSNFLTAYPWTSNVGFGTKYANPTTPLSGSTPVDIDFAPDGSAVVACDNGSPFIYAYRWSGNGFGAKYADPATLPAGATVGVAFSSNNNAIASVNGTGSPNLEAWRWDSQAGFGTKYSDPATGTASQTRSLAFHPSDTAIAVTSSSSPFINAYAWTSASGFGTKFSNPATLPASGPLGPAPKSIAFSPAGDAVAMAHVASPYISVYAWSGSGFGTRFSNPATIPASTGYAVAFSPAGDAIAFLGGGSPGIYVYPWSGSGFGTKYTDPGTLLNAGLNLAFSPNGDTICAAMSGSPYIRAYPWSSATGFGTVYAQPSTLAPDAGIAIASTYNF